MSEARISLETAPEASRALRQLEQYIAGCGLARELIELVKLRVSMLNGCAFCVDRHWRALRDAGEPEQRLYSLSAWREQPGYSPRERAALEWAESLTRVAETRVPDQDFELISAHFTAKEVADLSFVIVAINAWNRLCVAFRIPPANVLPARLDPSASAESRPSS
jgi:AhpD family alkylhydroperoxidase